MADVTWGKGAELLELESVQRAISEAAQWAGEQAVHRSTGWARYYISRKPLRGDMLESPIEAIFAAWFFVVASAESGSLQEYGLLSQCAAVINGQNCRFDFIVD